MDGSTDLWVENTMTHTWAGDYEFVKVIWMVNKTRIDKIIWHNSVGDMTLIKILLIHKC